MCPVCIGRPQQHGRSGSLQSQWPRHSRPPLPPPPSRPAAAATPQERAALRDGFAALLLYHQVLGGGYSGDQLAARYHALTALGPSVDLPLTVDVSRAF